MKQIYFFTLIFFISLTTSAQLKVVTTLPDFKYLTEIIGGNKVDVFAIATGFQNPHFVDPKPSYILKLAKADLFITVGLDLESGWVPSLLNSSRNSKIQKGSVGYIDASVNIPLLQVPNQSNRGEGDIHIYGNPHYWLDPENGKIIAQNITNALIKADQPNKEFYLSNLKKFIEQLDQKLLEWKTKFTSLNGIKIIAYHNEWPYFENRFGFNIVDFLEPKPGIPPTPSQLNKVISEIKSNHIKIIMSSPYFTTESAELVARNTDAKVIVLATSVGATKEIATYFDLFEYNLTTLLKALQ